MQRVDSRTIGAYRTAALHAERDDVQCMEMATQAAEVNKEVYWKTAVEERDRKALYRLRRPPEDVQQRVTFLPTERHADLLYRARHYNLQTSINNWVIISRNNVMSPPIKE